MKLVKFLSFTVVMLLYPRTCISVQSNALFRLIASGHRLTDNVVKECETMNVMECAFLCQALEKPSACKSMNFKARKNQCSSKNCQLNSVTKSTAPQKLREDEEYDYYEKVITKKGQTEDAVKQVAPTTAVSPSVGPTTAVSPSVAPTTAVSPSVLPKHKECFGYKWLTESDRNKKYTNRSNIKCDDSDLSPGWYRFGGGAGIKMPTSCVSKWRCSTHASGWMNGAHPTVTEGNVTRKVCYHWDSACCNWSNNIEVVNCGQYYVYKLSSPPTCWLRYCGSDN